MLGTEDHAADWLAVTTAFMKMSVLHGISYFRIYVSVYGKWQIVICTPETRIYQTFFSVRLYLYATTDLLGISLII